jgi:hypothetical protein
MKTAWTLLLALGVGCAASKSTPAPAGAASPQTAGRVAVAAPSVIVTTDPNAVSGCRLISRTEQAYDIREPDQWRKLQEEAARLGGNAAMVPVEGDHKAEIYACSRP